MGPFGSDIKKANFVDAGVPVIRGGNLTAGLVEDRYVFLTESKADELKTPMHFQATSSLLTAERWAKLV